MISSGKINNKFIKMEEIINGLKQIKTRVDSGTITTVNGTETLLSKQLASMLEKAINYTRCCENDSEQLHKLLQYLSDEDELIGNRTHQQIIDNFKKLV